MQKKKTDWHLVISDFAYVICSRLQLQIQMYFKNDVWMIKTILRWGNQCFCSGFFYLPHWEKSFRRFSPAKFYLRSCNAHSKYEKPKKKSWTNAFQLLHNHFSTFSHCANQNLIFFSKAKYQTKAQHTKSMIKIATEV